MQGSRIRTFLGVGLILIGSLFLLRSIIPPIAVVVTPMPAAHEVVDEIRLEGQQAQIELRRAVVEARDTLGDQLRLGSPDTSDIAPLPAMPAIPPLPPLPPMPPTPPLSPFWHLGAWLNPAIVLFALLLLIVWRRGRGECESRRA
ncbi:MAG TPA: hypothetical protein VF909_15400 [Roseiflexaceae bacterium]